MRDILFPAIVVGFFAAATLLIKACELLTASGEPRDDEGAARR